MTTIAYRDGTIACDSCWAVDGAVDTLSKKIKRLKYGVLLGSAGDGDARVFDKLLSVKRPEDLPTYEQLIAMRLESMHLIIFPDRRIFKIATNYSQEDGAGVWEVEGTFTAIGIGSHFAIGAMEAGATARQAVVIACRRDINSRLPVHTLSLPKKGK